MGFYLFVLDETFSCYAEVYALLFLNFLTIPNPAMPEPRSNRVPGSGTEADAAPGAVSEMFVRVRFE